MLPSGLRQAFLGSGTRVRLTRASVAAMFLKLLHVALGFAITVVLARAMGPAGLGLYALALAVVMVLGMPAKAGLPQLVTRETAKAHAKGDWGAVKGVWRWSSSVVLVNSAAVLVATLAIATFVPSIIPSEIHKTLLLGVFLVPIMGLALIRASALRGLGCTILGQLPELAIQPIGFLAFLITWLVFSTSSLSADWAIGLNLLASLVAFGFGMGMLARVKPAAMKGVEPSYESRSWLAAVIPMASINAMHLINTQVDIVLIGVFLDATAAGVYKVAAQVALIVAFGLQATKMVVEPYFSRFHQQGDTTKLRSIARAASRLNAAVAMIVIVFLVLFGQQFLHVAFGAAFYGAFTPLMILASGRCLSACVASSGSLLVMAGFHRQYATFWMLAAMLNVVLNLILIPLFGLAGAASATALTLLIPYLLGWWAAKRWLACDCSPFGRNS